MNGIVNLREELAVDPRDLSSAEQKELQALGMLRGAEGVKVEIDRSKAPDVERSAIQAPSVLNEAPDYGSAFSRGLRIPLGDYTLLMISGTASVDEKGDTLYEGDFRAQCWRTYRNITELLTAEGATWKDIVKTTCYLRDIERDYDEFNDVRTTFFNWLQLDPLPASVGIQARLCRSDLLIEIEAMAILKNK